MLCRAPLQLVVGQRVIVVPLTSFELLPGAFGWVIDVMMYSPLEVVQEHAFAIAKRTVRESVASGGSRDGHG
jgi:hypothetical protein